MLIIFNTSVGREMAADGHSGSFSIDGSKTMSSSKHLKIYL